MEAKGIRLSNAWPRNLKFTRANTHLYPRLAREYILKHGGQAEYHRQEGSSGHSEERFAQEPLPFLKARGTMLHAPDKESHFA